MGRFFAISRCKTAENVLPLWQEIRGYLKTENMTNGEGFSA